ncbi:unnamed protein product [Prorocentrum cordatum]|uniref:ribonuclease Z n=1 Tax=Prorocentrum cordatum TaxID=2364126 RepID=A0ABN9U538_9DINO|nr:unnamed protein product [Polarella glacialis]
MTRAAAQLGQVADSGDAEPELLFLGTGSAKPTSQRGQSAILLRWGDFSALLDCGGGTWPQMETVRLLGEEAALETLNGLSLVWISHHHADHCAGLPALLASRTAPGLRVVASPQVSRFWRSSLPMAGCGRGGALAAPMISAPVPAALGLAGERHLRARAALPAELRPCPEDWTATAQLVYSGDCRPSDELVAAALGDGGAGLKTWLVHEATFNPDEQSHTRSAGRDGGCRTRRGMRAARVPPLARRGRRALPVLWLQALLLLGGVRPGEGRFTFLSVWNPQNLLSPARLDEVSRALAGVGIVGLPGTCVRQWWNEPHHKATSVAHHVVHFGWQRSRLVNKSCGCALMLAKKYFGVNDIRRLVTPPVGLRGRGGLAYLASGPLLLAVFVLYFPPRPAAKGEAPIWRDTCRALVAWARDELLRVPQRYTPVLLMDLNSGLSQHFDEDPVVGQFGAATESYAGKLVHEWLAGARMQLINTTHRVGNTFFGMGGASSQIDYICAPQSAGVLVEWAKAWHRTAEAARASPAILDHVPVVAKIRIVPPLNQLPLRERWDRPRLSGAVLSGSGREQFMTDLHEAFLEIGPSLDVLETREATTGHATLVMGTIRKIGLAHFSQATVRPMYEKKLDEKKWQLLRERRTILEEVKAQEFEAMQRCHETPSSPATLPSATGPTVRTLGSVIRSYTKALQHWRRRRAHERQKFTEDELRHAWRGRDMAQVPRLARSLARTGIGVKNRNYRAHASCNPTCDEWSTFLAQGPLLGGLAAVRTTIPLCHNLKPDRLTDLGNTSDYAITHAVHMSKGDLRGGQSDFKMTIKALRRTKIGKLAPSWHWEKDDIACTVLSCMYDALDFYPRRRRGHLMMATRIAAWKGHHSGQHMLHKSYDATNAFGRGRKEDLERSVRARLEEDEEIKDQDLNYVTAISRQRRTALAVVIPAADGEVALRMQNLPEVDASLGCFMDDTFKTQLLSAPQSASEVIRLSLRSDSQGLDQALLERAYGQNRAKQDVVPAFPSRQLVRRTIAELNRSGCRSIYELKHLGAWFNAVNSNSNELKARLAAITKGWMMVQGFWYSSSPLRIKRLMFISLVSGAALSGTVAFCWTAAETKQLCGALACKLRSMMGGTAKAGPSHITTLTTREVYRHWNIVPFALEATVQRLKAWQAIARAPRNHAHLLAIFYGEMQREATSAYRCPPTLLEDGRFNDTTLIHPWARQLRQDLEVMCSTPEAESFAEVWGFGSMLDRLWDEEVNYLFISFDPRCLRSAFAAAQWAPPPCLADTVPAAQDDQQTWEKGGQIHLSRHAETCTVQTKAEGEEARGACLRAILIEEKSSVVKAIQQESKDFSDHAANLRTQIGKYKEDAKKASGSDAGAEKEAATKAEEVQKELRTLGPPAPALFAAPVESLATEEVGAVNRRALEAMKQEFVEAPPMDVRLCRLESCKDEDMIKIVLALDDKAKEGVITASLHAMGAQVTSGMAPSGYMEDEISAWIDALKDSTFLLQSSAASAGEPLLLVDLGGTFDEGSFGLLPESAPTWCKNETQLTWKQRKERMQQQLTLEWSKKMVRQMREQNDTVPEWMDKIVSDDEKRGRMRWAAQESKRMRAEGKETPKWMDELVEEDTKWANRWAACKAAELKEANEEVASWMPRPRRPQSSRSRSRRWRRRRTRTRERRWWTLRATSRTPAGGPDAGQEEGVLREESVSSQFRLLEGALEELEQAEAEMVSGGQGPTRRFKQALRRAKSASELLDKLLDRKGTMLSAQMSAAQ